MWFILRSVNDKVERIGKKAIAGVMAVVSWHLCLWTEENSEITQWCCGRDSNRIPAEHKPRSLRLCQSVVGRSVRFESFHLRLLIRANAPDCRTYGESSDIPRPCGYNY
jgi:hypothetical protein